MARPITIKATRGATRQLRAAIEQHLVKAQLGQTLVSFAQRRISNGGDSQHKYPELWATKTGMGYRAGGQPLRDTGQLMNSLSHRTRVRGDGIEMTLLDGTPSGYAVKHQEGFTNKGPQAIPLTRKAARVLGEPPHKRRDVLELGLVEGEDFMWVKGNTEVPPRLIFNTPPEDVRDLKASVNDALKGVKFGV